MSESWSPDEPAGTEAYEPWDEALDEDDELDPGRPGGPEGERSLDRQLVADRAAESEAGLDLDDPERMALLDGGMDDPDGLQQAPGTADDEGWDLDAGERRQERDDEA